VAAIGEMDADLVFSPGEQADEQPRFLAVRFDCFVISNGALPLGGARAAGNGADGAVGALDQVRFDATLRRIGLAFNHRLVRALDGVPEELGLKRLVRAVGLGKDQQPRGVAVEAVDQADAGARLSRLDIPADDRQRRGTALLCDRAGEQACGLVDDEDVIVFVDELERMKRRQRLGLVRFGKNADDVGGAQRLGEAPCRRAVDDNAAAGERLPRGNSRVSQCSSVLESVRSFIRISWPG
jgi:hypothetical protein